MGDGFELGENANLKEGSSRLSCTGCDKQCRDTEDKGAYSFFLKTHPYKQTHVN